MSSQKVPDTDRQDCLKEKNNKKYICISGNYQERFAQAVAAIDNILK